MTKSILFGAVTLLALPLLAGESEDIKAAAKKLADQGNYAWRTTVVVPEGSRFKPGPTEGKTEKDGYTFLSMTMNDNTIEAVVKGAKGPPRMEEGRPSLPEILAAGPTGPGTST